MSARPSHSRMAEACRMLDGCVMAAGELGAELWPHRTGGVSSNGGGDYAAQMLLGRMRKLGLVRTTHDPGSSRWELTIKGHEVADLVARAGHRARQLDATEFEVTRHRRALDETEQAIATAMRSTDKKPDHRREPDHQRRANGR